MNHLITAITKILLFLILTNSTLLAQRYIFNEQYDKQNKTNAKLIPIISTLPAAGYSPFRLILKNGTKSPKSWSLKFTSNASLYGGSYYRGKTPTLISEYAYTCPPESTKTFDIIVPVVSSIPDSHTSLLSPSLNIELKSGNTKNINSFVGSKTSDLPAILLSSDLYTQHSSVFNSLILHTSSTSRYANEELVSEFNPSIMSSDWRAYSGFDAFICTDKDWLTMTPDVQVAILEWNRLGGDILIYNLNPSSNLKSLNINKSETKSNLKQLKRSFGTITINPLANIKSLDPKEAKKILTRAKITPSKIHNINNNYQQTDSLHKSTWSLQQQLKNLNFSPLFLILLLITFGILVGPINLFVFAKAGQRHRLFITTPIIALGASLLLIITIIIQDGFGGHGHRVQLIEVRADNGENKAYVWQEQVARTGVVLSSSFKTSSPALISPLPLAPSRLSRVTIDNQGGALNYFADNSQDGLSLSGDWFQSRSIHGHYIESIIPLRSKITLKSNHPTPMINSSFEYPIQNIIYKDNNGQIWTTSNIKAGESKTLTPINPVESIKLIHKHYANMSEKLKAEVDILSKRKGHFTAFTDQAPAVSTLESIDWKNTSSIITGPVVK